MWNAYFALMSTFDETGKQMKNKNYKPAVSIVNSITSDWTEKILKTGEVEHLIIIENDLITAQLPVYKELDPLM